MAQRAFRQNLEETKFISQESERDVDENSDDKSGQKMAAGGYSDDEKWAGERWKRGTTMSGMRMWKQWSRRRIDTDRWMADTDWSAWDTWETRKAFGEWRRHAKLRSEKGDDESKRRCMRYMLGQTQHW